VEYNFLIYNYSHAGKSSTGSNSGIGGSGSSGTDTPLPIYPTLRTVNSGGFDAFYRDEVSSFDIALSVSSFDHDGLGTHNNPYSAVFRDLY
jgi:hypothetical protein